MNETPLAPTAGSVKEREKHSPTPWDYDVGQRDPKAPNALPRWSLTHSERYDTSGMVGAGIVTSSMSRFAYINASEADVALICRAVNNHAQLLNMCKDALVRLDRLEDNGTGEHSPCYLRIQAAITEAEKPTKD